jgi:hypothetical protein
MGAKDLEQYKFKKGDKRASEAGKKSKRKPSLKRALRDYLAKETSENGKLSEENVVKSVLLHAMKGNSGMAKLIFEYVDGKVKDIKEHTGPDGGPINVLSLTKEEYKTLRKEMLEDDEC